MSPPRAALAAALTLLLSPLPAPAAAAPAHPEPWAVCDNQPALHPEPPDAAVVVDPAVDADLHAKTSAHPPGTTFWLAPGTHTLGQDEFGQVMPKDGNTYLGAPGAVLDGQGINRFAFTRQARDVTLRGLTIQGFAAPKDQGVVNHDSGDGWVIEHNTIQRNDGAALMAGDRQQVRGNCLRDNGQYGMNAYQRGDGITGLVVAGNEITGNNTGDWETREPGCGCTGGIKFWAVDGADIRGNWVHHNHGPGLWADTNNNDFLIEGNLIEDNEAEAVFYEISYNLVLRDNVIRRNTWAMGRRFAERGDDFPVGTVYVSESGGEPRVPARTDRIEIHDNLFEDNWSGITLWENADRFCNSPANTSSGYCTRLVEEVAACARPGIETPPLDDDCRWKTQRVDVRGNTFRIDPAAMGCADRSCGRMAVLANYGTYPDWSPYHGFGVAGAITFGQDNHWSRNTYAGPWSFVAHDVARALDAAQWQAAPYHQDTCSSFTPDSPAC
ncbi:parallel beta helix pectate lyase-like protein [Prauserella shujinwangii]|uniref:Parallel beta helix pectate lyase-like protein n=1 Tax=Prauserella shujinwangii TaxID=1453103 RepID=A0A2T0LQM6_9PSEU|nr:right-handed parallel beta-helix repeat-containing protein [Prauserella shujinwangii]PRX45621.1 parallel beta helix pectate lyase-like protein [Prauserella shujinwangii]